MAVTIFEMLGRDPDRHVRLGEPTWSCRCCGFDFHDEEPPGRICRRCDAAMDREAARESCDG